MQLKGFKDPVIHIPTCISAVVICYNLPQDIDIKFSRSLLEKIFLGKITRWNDPLIKRLNPSVSLPDLAITVIHRSDGSGTTSLFTEYLSTPQSKWEKKAGQGMTVKWPVGIGVAKNSGLANMLKKKTGGIGYVQMHYAIKNKLRMAAIQNQNRKFIKPTLESISAAVTAVPKDTRMSITNTHALYGYPISSLSWILIYKEQNYHNQSKKQGIELVKFLQWILTKGQIYSKPLFYSKIPKHIEQKALRALKQITYNGEKLDIRKN